ncbi:MAG: RNA-binding S4 domain-containing protein, partial [Gemmobacter sp.]
VILANEVTALLHGPEAARAAEATARAVFEQGGIGGDLPTVAVTAEEAAEGISLPQLFVRAGLAKSGKDAKRLIAEGGARVNDAEATDAGRLIRTEDLAAPLKLTAGRKRHALVVIG